MCLVKTDYFVTNPTGAFKLFALSSIIFVPPSHCRQDAIQEICSGAQSLKTTAANIDKEAARWSLAKHPDDSCASFTREAILACAPPASGVYVLFNFDCQILIGESANVQQALLRHESETDFQYRHLRPTGFTFEPCAAELRKTKADELIARFLPMLQTDATLTGNRVAINRTNGGRGGPGRSKGRN